MPSRANRNGSWRGWRLALGPALLLAAGGCGAPPAEPPNVVLILADDLGYGDLDPEAPARTPHLDALAAEGLRFRDFHSSSAWCAPTRASLLTGRHPARFTESAHRGSRAGWLPPEEQTLAELLRGAGYRTAIVGKWHLGLGPLQHGFDEFVGSLDAHIDYQSHVGPGGWLDWWHGEERVDEPGYATELVTRHAVDFLERNRNRRFFLYVSYHAPHAPLQGPYDPVERVDRSHRSEEEKARFRSEINARIPEPPPDHVPGDPYREMVESLDVGVGRIVAALAQLGLERETFVFFHSDNGPVVGSAGALRGKKLEVFEGGHRVPAIARWPGRIEPGISDVTATSMDLFPTIAALSGARPRGEVELDGSDLGPVLFEGEDLPARMFFWKQGALAAARAASAVRRGRWKLVVQGDEVALFDLERDLGESRDLSAEQPERVAELRAALAAWEARVDPRAARRRAPQRP